MPSQEWRTRLGRRITICAVVLCAWAVAIEGRLLHLQIVRHDELVARAERQQSRILTVFANRGEIFDRHGNLLASSVTAETIFATPPDIKEPKRAVRELCHALGNCTTNERKTLEARLSSSREEVFVRRKVSSEEAARVRALQLPGIGFRDESRRFYPNRQLASHILGYVRTIDNEALAGLELTYDKLLQGEAGKELIRKDAKHRPFSSIRKAPIPGASLELTLDEHLQYIVETELETGVRENGARAGSAVMMDPWSGEILAMASWPTFNPNTYNDATEQQRLNRAVHQPYEPGSTFKIVTAAAALDQHLVTPTQLVNASGGRIRLGTRVVSDTHDYGVLSFSDVIVKSSNVGAIRVGLRLGPERLSEYVRRFGFGKPSSRDFRREHPGIVWDPARLTDSAVASLSMGYQVSVTPLQMAAAVSSIANGGELVQPRVVRAVIREGVRTPVPRTVVGKTINDRSVVAQMTAIMEKVVEEGTATAARVEGFTVAGKTGTAAQLVDGRYSVDLWNASFVGFVPSRKPEFTLIVVLDAPRTKGHTGGVAAAPVFKRIAERVLRHVGVPRSVDPLPPILAGRREPEAIAPAHLLTPATTAGAAVVPDLYGRSAREAAQVLAGLGIDVRLRGHGLVVAQDPPPGTRVDEVSTSVLRLETQPDVAGGQGR